ncbi:MAG: carboxypeptidase regulatory-like domain-containing protein [Anaerolineales bacterium]|nr:carboxypeptidase regulatory-like domain-containing protein [Anaerolineales bacterium]
MIEYTAGKTKSAAPPWRSLAALGFLLAIAGGACVVSGDATGEVVYVTATPESGGGGGSETEQAGPPSSGTAESGPVEPSPTFTVAHLNTPPGAGGTTRYVTDPVTRDYAPQKRAPSGSDIFAGNRWERPYTAEAMEYLSDVDLERVELRIVEPWIYLTFFFIAPRAAGVGQTVYGGEFDLDRDGRGDVLVWGISPSGADWTVQGVEAWEDGNNDVGGAHPQAGDPPASNADGYERKLFADGQGADPDLAWIRQTEGGAKVQLAFKYSALGNASAFLWNGLADAGIRRSDWFDYNDHFTAAEAGSPFPAQADLYPLKGIWGLDNTCRDAYGFTPSGTEPGLCMYNGTISGRLWLDGTCDNLAGWHNGVIDDGEPGSDAGQITLGQGACPSSGYRSTAPGADGRFSFTEVPAGTYCVSHEYAGWIEYTTPHPVTVELAAGESEVVNIGIYVELGCPPGGF